MKYEELRQHGFPPHECDFILKTIRREVELYKEALELMAKDYYFDYLIEMTDYNVSQTIEKYLQKAREYKDE